MSNGNGNVKIKYNKIEGSVPYVQVEQIVDFDAAIALMDDEIREAVHQEFSPCSQQKFATEYCKAHFKKFGKEFRVN